MKKGVGRKAIAEPAQHTRLYEVRVKCRFSLRCPIHPSPVFFAGQKAQYEADRLKAVQFCSAQRRAFYCVLQYEI